MVEEQHIVIKIESVSTDLGRAVDVLDVEEAAEAVEQELGNGGHERRRRHEHVEHVGSRLDNGKRLLRYAQPIVGELLDVGAQLRPLVGTSRVLSLGGGWLHANGEMGNWRTS